MRHYLSQEVLRYWKIQQNIGGFMNEPRLQRFLDAQRQLIPYEQALKEIQQGKRQSDWMPYVFPQLKGLGESAVAQDYALADFAEAEAYYNHPILRSRLGECARELMRLKQTFNRVTGRYDIKAITAEDIFGEQEAEILHACMTLFAEVGKKYSGRSWGDYQDKKCFQIVLGLYFDGAEHLETLKRLGIAGYFYDTHVREYMLHELRRKAD